MTTQELSIEELVKSDNVSSPEQQREAGRYQRRIGQWTVALSNHRWSPEGLRSEICVEDLAQKRVLHRGDICLTSVRDKDTLARFLEKATDGKYWFRDLGDFFGEVFESERSAALPRLLRDVEAPTEDPLIDAGGIPLLRDHPGLACPQGRRLCISTARLSKVESD